MKPSRATTDLPVVSILGLCVGVSSLAEMAGRVIDWAVERKSRFICVANVHMTMEAWDSEDFQRVLNSADAVIADGQPLVWAQRLLGARQARRVRGPDLMMQLCARAAATGVPIALYGGREGELETLVDVLRTSFPGIHISAAIAPPFRSLSDEENERYTRVLDESQAGIVFVGIGCPKQELWMARNRERIHGVMIGVGAAFDMISGRVPSAPAWMRDHGLDWLFRLLCEPRRLWKRYLKHNPRFVLFFGWQWIRFVITSSAASRNAITQ